MKKRIVASLLTVAMAMGLLAGCGKESAKGTDTTTVSNETEDVVINGITYKKALDMTDEEITLRYFHFDQDETVQYLAERFMEIYPNITVEPVYENVQTYMTTLTNMMAEGDVPDVIMYSDCDTALTNQWLGDISGFWDTDEETKQMASTTNDCGIGKFGTTARYAAPVKFFPGVMLIDRNVLKTLNVEVPGQVSAVAVGIANGNGCHQRLPGGDEGAAVADFPARRQRLEVADPAEPFQCGFEMQQIGVNLVAGIQPVGDNAGTHHIVVPVKVHQTGGIV